MRAPVALAASPSAAAAARAPRRVQAPATSCSAVPVRPSEWMRSAAAGALAAVVVLAAPVAVPPPALAGLNEREAAAGGEFGIGSAQQFGEADLKGRSFAGQDLRRSNFTSADVRDGSFKGAKCQGAYFIKTVAARTNFEGADLSDVLMDRAVMVEANLKNAVLARAVFTRSDLTNAQIEGADFSNALVDKAQQMALCKYAAGTNPTTGADTRKSLGCGSKRAFKAMSPTAGAGEVGEADKAAFRATLPQYRQ